MKILPFIKILRPMNLIIVFISVWAGVVIAEGKILTGNYLNIFIAAFAAMLITGAGNVINDFFDIEIDRENNKIRPLVTGEITPKNAIVYYIILNIVALLLIYFFLPNDLFIIALITVVILLLYPKFLKILPIVGNVVVGILTGLVFIYAGLLSETWWYDLMPFLFAFEINFLRELVKDIEDIKGDALHEHYTMAVILGEKMTKIIAIVFTFILILSTFLPYEYLKYSEIYIYSVNIFVNIPLLFFVYKFSREKVNYKTIHRILKSVMIFGLISILLGVLK